MYQLSTEDLEVQGACAPPHRRGDPLRGRGRAERRRAAARCQGPAPRAGSGARAAGDEHAGGARRRRLHNAAAGARPGAGRSGDERPRLDGDDAAAVVRRGGNTGISVEQWLDPGVRGEASECYAITEEGAGSDVDAIQATARRDGDEYVLNGVKWHVTSYNDASYAFFQAKLTGGPHAGRARDVHRRSAVAGRSGGAHSRLLPLDRPPPPDRRLRGRARSRHASRRRRGGRDGVRVRVVPFREGHGRGPMHRGRRAADRGGHGVREGAASSTGRRIIDFQLIQAMLADSLTELFARAVDRVRDGPRHRCRHGRQGPARARIDGEAVRVRDGEPGGGPGRADLRRSRVHARRTSPSASSASSGSKGSGRARARCSA